MTVDGWMGGWIGRIVHQLAIGEEGGGDKLKG